MIVKIKENTCTKLDLTAIKKGEFFILRNHYKKNEDDFWLKTDSNQYYRLYAHDADNYSFMNEDPTNRLDCRLLKVKKISIQYEVY